MAAGVTSRLWEIGDIVDVLEAWEVTMTDKIASETQKLTIRPIYQLAAIAKMPTVGVHLSSRRTSRPIVIWEKPNITGNMRRLTIWQFLSLDVAAAIAKGGTFTDLLQSKRIKQPWPPTRDIEPLEQDTLDQALSAVGLKEAQLPQSK
jgi:hypothetical protein